MEYSLTLQINSLLLPKILLLLLETIVFQVTQLNVSLRVLQTNTFIATFDQSIWKKELFNSSIICHTILNFSKWPYIGCVSPYLNFCTFTFNIFCNVEHDF